MSDYLRDYERKYKEALGLPSIEEVTKAMMENQTAAVEAFCRLLVLEKGPCSVVDYELVQQMDGSVVRWYFRKRT